MKRILPSTASERALGAAAGLAVAVGSLGCSDLPPPREWTGSVDTLQGVPVVTNSPTPIDVEGTVGLEELWTIGEGGRDAAGRLWENAHKVSATAERIYILDRGADQVFVYDRRTGAPGITVGRPGDGPGELTDPFDIAIAAGTIAIADPSAGRVNLYGLDGAFQRSLRLQSPVTHVLGFASGALAVRPVQPFENGSPWGSIAGDTIAAPLTISEPIAFADTLRLGGGAVGCVRYEPAGGDRFMEFRCRIPYMRFLSPSGTSLTEAYVDIDPVLSSDGDLQPYLDRVRSSVEDQFPPETVERFVEQAIGFQRIQNRFDAAAYDAARRLSVLREVDPLRVDDSTGSTLHLFVGSGAYLARIDLPETWADFAMYDGRLYAIRTDPLTDLPMLTAYRLADPNDILVTDPLAPVN